LRKLYPYLVVLALGGVPWVWGQPYDLDKVGEVSDVILRGLFDPESPIVWRDPPVFFEAVPDAVFGVRRALEDPRVLDLERRSSQILERGWQEVEAEIRRHSPKGDLSLRRMLNDTKKWKAQAEPRNYTPGEAEIQTKNEFAAEMGGQSFEHWILRPGNRERYQRKVLAYENQENPMSRTRGASRASMDAFNDWFKKRWNEARMDQARAELGISMAEGHEVLMRGADGLSKKIKVTLEQVSAFRLDPFVNNFNRIESGASLNGVGVFWVPPLDRSHSGKSLLLMYWMEGESEKLGTEPPRFSTQAQAVRWLEEKQKANIPTLLAVPEGAPQMRDPFFRLSRIRQLRSLEGGAAFEAREARAIKAAKPDLGSVTYHGYAEASRRARAAHSQSASQSEPGQSDALLMSRKNYEKMLSTPVYRIERNSMDGDLRGRTFFQVASLEDIQDGGDPVSSVALMGSARDGSESKSNRPDLTVRSVGRLDSTDGVVEIPVPEGHELVRLEIRDLEGRRLEPNEVQILRSPRTGALFAKTANPDQRLETSFEYKKRESPAVDVPISVEGLRRMVSVAREAGLEPLAGALERLMTPEGSSVSRVAQAISDSGRYAYDGDQFQSAGGMGSGPLAKYRAFADSQGRICAQCVQFAELGRSLLEVGLAGTGHTPFIQVSRVAEGGAIVKLGHERIGVFSGGGRPPLVVDATARAGAGSLFQRLRGAAVSRYEKIRSRVAAALTSRKDEPGLAEGSKKSPQSVIAEFVNDPVSVANRARELNQDLESIRKELLELYQVDALSGGRSVSRKISHDPTHPQRKASELFRLLRDGIDSGALPPDEARQIAEEAERVLGALDRVAQEQRSGRGRYPELAEGSKVSSVIKQVLERMIELARRQALSSQRVTGASCAETIAIRVLNTGAQGQR
jgi:hypothetical protein